MCVFVVMGSVALVACGTRDGRPRADGGGPGDDPPPASLPGGPCVAGEFARSPALAVGRGPTAVAAADLNGDGKPDLVTANGDSSVSVLLGNGDGTFHAHQDYATGSGPIAIAVADFNSDGKLDVVTLDGGGNAVSVLLGSGDGTLGTQTQYATGGSPVRLGVADVNGDGVLDLVTGNSSDSLSVLLGHGDGTFTPHTDTIVVGGIEHMAVGDFNGDHKPDLAISIFSTVVVLLGNGDGSFSNAPVAAVDFRVGALAVADFTGDGKLDIAVTAADEFTGAVPTVPGEVVVLAGTGDGSLVPGSRHAIGGGTESLVAADIDGDSRPDMTSIDRRTGTLSVLRNDGATPGDFMTLALYVVDGDAHSLAVADFDGDGQPDVAITQQGSGTLRVVRGTEQHTLQAQATALDIVIGVRVGDVNGDGKLDAVSFEADPAPAQTTTMLVQLGRGAAGLDVTPTRVPLAVRAIDAIIADVNGDGNADIIVPGISPTAGMVQIALGHGDGTFTPGAAFAFGRANLDPNDPVFAVDVDRDGQLDLVTIGSDTTVAVMRGNGDGTFGPARQITTVTTPGDVNRGLAVGDVDGNTTLDLVVVTSGAINVLTGAGDGTFVVYVSEPGDFMQGPITLAEVNQDNRLDLVGRSFYDNIAVWLNVGGSMLFAPSSFSNGPGDVIGVRDVDGDGHTDVVVVSRTFDMVNVLYGDGTGRLTAVPYPTGVPLTSPVLGDIDGDGKLDIVYVGGSGAGTVRVLYGSCVMH